MNKKHSFNKFVSIYFLISILFFPILKKTIFSSEQVEVTLNYKRFNNDYSDWNLWIWEEGKDGFTKEFEKENDYGQTASIKINKNINSIGFLLKKGNWTERDISKDRFIPLKNEDINIYLLQGDDTIYYTEPNNNLISLQKSKYLNNSNKDFSYDLFDSKYFYNGEDLGVTLQKNNTKFVIWAPTAEKVTLNLYSEGSGDNLIKSVDLKNDVNGTWNLTIPENLENKYYTYTVKTTEGSNEVVDLYAKGVGINGERGMILDLEKTNPKNWKNYEKPIFKNTSDAIIYEIHIRDFSIDKNSGIKNKGKFLGMIEEGTINTNGDTTGIDYLKELGVTHVQILPAFDFASIDETKIDNPHFNWGYDPKNYNVPEGSYSTDPFDGRVRINEFKEMIQGFHKNGIRVIMDVVYNHTAASHNSYFNLTVPNYYYRMTNNDFSNASGCGNETASERLMMRKYIIDSVKYWAKEYNIDGFRFDLMGIHDIETMNEIRKELDKIDPTIIVYGEPWAAGPSPLDASKRALKENTYLLNRIGVFNDDIRDGIKGSVFDSKDTGFATGKDGVEERIKFGIVGAVNHPQVNYTKPWANSPTQSINYASAHDNLTLWDKISSSRNDLSLEDRLKMNKLSQSIVMTSQGVVFIHAGEEILRSKPLGDDIFDENSYKSDENINSIKWLRNEHQKDMYEYYKGLINFRKNNPGLRMLTQEDVEKNIIFEENLPENIIAYTIKSNNSTNQEKDIFIIHNARHEDAEINLPEGKWEVYINNKKAGTEVLEIVTDKINVNKISSFILKRK